jgi:hypothetical protein
MGFFNVCVRSRVFCRVRGLVVSKDFTLEDVLKVKKYYSLRNKRIPFEEQVAEARAAHKRFDEYMAKRGVVRGKVTFTAKRKSKYSSLTVTFSTF